MKEIRVHGRGGQGGMAGARILATGFVLEGAWVSSFPEFGFERRGAPVRCFLRVDDQPIVQKTKVYTPDCLVIIDPLLIQAASTFDGLKPGGIVVINSSKGALPDGQFSAVGVVNATRIGVEEIGTGITNTCMLGAFARTTGWITLDSVLLGLREYFDGQLLKKNMRCVERGFAETVVIRPGGKGNETEN